MKTAIILFHSPNSAFDGEYLDKIISIFYNNGFPIDSVDMVSVNDDLGFTRKLESLKDTVDNLLVINNPLCAFDVRELIAKNFDTVLDENENAVKFLDAVSKTDGIDYPKEFALIPFDATLIPNVLGAEQGFMLDDKEFTLALLTSKIKELNVMVDKYLIPYLESKYNLKRKRITLKYMGQEDKIKAVIEEAKSLSSCKFTYNISQAYGDFKVEFIFENYETDNGGAIIRHVVSSLKDDIYAEYDVGLAERLFDLLTLKKLKLSTAESFTSGKIASAIIENSGASNVFNEGMVCYSNKSKIKRLGVKIDDLEREGAVSSIVAYQMALGLLKETDCDVAIATTGIAGPKSDNTLKPVGLCYIAVGMRDGIHTYKLNLSGNRECITEKAKNKALFLTIKKLKNL